MYQELTTVTNLLKALSEFGTTLSGFMVAGTAIFMAVIAQQGLTTWRRELKGKSEYTLAKEVLAEVHRFHHVLIQARIGESFKHEHPEGIWYNGHGQLEGDDKIWVELQVYKNRIDRLDDSLKALLEKVIEAQVEWGGEHILKLCELQRLRGIVVKALFEHIHHLEDPQYQKQHIEGYDPEDIRMGDGPQTSKFNTEIRRRIDAFEHWLRPHIDPKWKPVDKAKK